jgi:hypothetical protein
VSNLFAWRYRGGSNGSGIQLDRRGWWQLRTMHSRTVEESQWTLSPHTFSRSSDVVKASSFSGGNTCLTASLKAATCRATPWRKDMPHSRTPHCQHKVTANFLPPQTTSELAVGRSRPNCQMSRVLHRRLCTGASLLAIDLPRLRCHLWLGRPCTRSSLRAFGLFRRLSTLPTGAVSKV